MKKIVTIGVYGFTKEHFIDTLLKAQVDTFCDIRLRRGLRGSEYAFANSESLQKTLRELGIRYIHLKELAPTQAIREKQKQEDEKLGIAKRKRQVLGRTFSEEYQQTCLAHFDSAAFQQRIGAAAEVACLFCVEREPEACHRSLVAEKLSQDLSLPIIDLKP